MTLFRKAIGVSSLMMAIASLMLAVVIPHV